MLAPEVLLVPPVNLDRAVLLVRPAPPARPALVQPEPLVPKALKAKPARQVPQDQPAPLAQLAKPALSARLGHLALLAQRELPVHKVPPVHKVQSVRRAFKV